MHIRTLIIEVILSQSHGAWRRLLVVLSSECMSSIVIPDVRISSSAIRSIKLSLSSLIHILFNNI